MKKLLPIFIFLTAFNFCLAEETQIPEEQRLIIHAPEIVEFDEVFVIKVTDQDNNPLEGITLTIIIEKDKDFFIRRTDHSGSVEFSSPISDTNLIMSAKMHSFEPGEKTVLVKSPPPPPEEKNLTGYVFLIFLVLIIIFYFITGRKKKADKTVLLAGMIFLILLFPRLAQGQLAEPGVSFTGEDVIIPTDVTLQASPIKVYGLAYRMVEYIENNDLAGVSFFRLLGPIAGPTDDDKFLGDNHYAGPYLLRDPAGNASSIIETVRNMYGFGSVNYYTFNQADPEADYSWHIKFEDLISFNPIKICAQKGNFDDPGAVFDAMGIPYTNWNGNQNWCLSNANALIFGCAGSIAQAGNHNYRQFVEDGGILIGTDGFSHFRNNTHIISRHFDDYIKDQTSSGAKAGSGTIWEGTVEDEWDLNKNSRQFWQNSVEKTSWHFMGGHTVLTYLSPEVLVLASGVYPQGEFYNYPMAVTFKHGKGRVFYLTFHIEGAPTDAEKAFMASIFSGALGYDLWLFPESCGGDTVKIGESKEICQIPRYDGAPPELDYTLKLTARGADVTDINLKAHIDDGGWQEVGWIVPSANNFSLIIGNSRFIDIIVSPPAGFTPGIYDAKIVITSNEVMSQEFIINNLVIEAEQTLPRADNLIASVIGDYCFAPYPPIELSWEFHSDDAGAIQAARQLQIATSPNFIADIIFNHEDNSSWHKYSPGLGVLSWSGTYYWRVRVWDDSGNRSDCGYDDGWCYPAFSSFTVAPQHPWPSFNSDPESPPVGTITQFCSVFESGVCQDEPSDGWTYCPFADPCNWSWDFENGIPSVSASENPQVIFSQSGDNNIVLEVCDSSNSYCCSTDEDVSVTLPLPDYREVAPIGLLDTFLARIINVFVR